MQICSLKIMISTCAFHTDQRINQSCIGLFSILCRYFTFSNLFTSYLTTVCFFIQHTFEYDQNRHRVVNLLTLTIFTMINMYLQCLRLDIELKQIQLPNSLLFLKRKILLMRFSFPIARQCGTGARMIQKSSPYYLLLLLLCFRFVSTQGKALKEVRIILLPSIKGVVCPPTVLTLFNVNMFFKYLKGQCLFCVPHPKKQNREATEIWNLANHSKLMVNPVICKKTNQIIKPFFFHKSSIIFLP